MGKGGVTVTVTVTAWISGVWVQGLHVAAHQRRAVFGQNVVVRACMYARACRSWIAGCGLRAVG